MALANTEEGIAPHLRDILDGVDTAAAVALAGLTSSAAELNLLDGVTASTAELNLLDGVTASTEELNLVDGLTATTAELNMAADVSAHMAAYTATGTAAIPATVRCIELNHATVVIAKTIADLSVYAGQFVSVKDISATGTAAHTVTITTGTWDGTNKVVTLNALNEAILVFVDSAGNGTVVANVGSVGLS